MVALFLAGFWLFFYFKHFPNIFGVFNPTKEGFSVFRFVRINLIVRFSFVIIFLCILNFAYADIVMYDLKSEAAS